jgi:hypothetical protein
MRRVDVCACVLMIGAVAVPAIASPQNRNARAGAKAAVPAAAASRSQTDSQIAAESQSKLPIRRVILYKTGVGYFEHLGEVRGDQVVGIDFTSGQLNDVLQSLTVLDLGGGRITAVDYNSEAPFAQRLGMLRLPLGDQTNMSNFYTALRGALLEVHSGTSDITGRLLSVQQDTRVVERTSVQVNVLTLVSDAGDVRSVDLGPGVSVRVADHDVNEEVGRYLSLLSSERQQDLRRMTISTSGSGERQLFVSYISEVPIWKTTYRIVMPTKPGDEPLLQGWAIVDNTVGEDWNNVELSLVAGSPQSFIEQLSQPYYARRPVVPLPQAAQLTPQTHESAMLGGATSIAGTVTDPTGANIPGAQVSLFDSSGNLVGSQTADDQGHYEFDGLSSGTYRLDVSKAGFQQFVINGLSPSGGNQLTQDVTMRLGSVSETVEVEAAPAPRAAANDKLEAYAKIFTPGAGLTVGVGSGSGGGMGPSSFYDALSRGTSAASGQELGDLFEYKLKNTVTIHKNESALVPIVQTNVKAEKVSLWNESSGSQRPLRALWITNSSGLTLDGGSFSVIEDNAFAGEGLTDPIKPGEKRLISYAADLGVRVNSREESDPQRVTEVRIIRGMMIQTSQFRQKTTYTINDDDTTPRTVLIEHPVRGGWKLAKDTPKPAEETSSVYRFRVDLKPKTEAQFAVTESRPIESNYALTNLTNDQIDMFVHQGSINSQIEEAFRKIVAQKAVVAGLDAEIAKRAHERQQIFADQQRIRENLKALKGTAEERALTERYTKQLSDQETQLETLQKESADLQSKRDAAQAQLDNMIQNLTLDTTI